MNKWKIKMNQTMLLSFGLLLFLGYTYWTLVSEDTVQTHYIVNAYENQFTNTLDIHTTEETFQPVKDQSVKWTNEEPTPPKAHGKKTKKITGVFQQQLDHERIEVKVNQQPVIFICSQSLANLTAGAELELVYFVNSKGQFEVVELLY